MASTNGNETKDLVEKNNDVFVDDSDTETEDTETEDTTEDTEIQDDEITNEDDDNESVLSDMNFDTALNKKLSLQDQKIEKDLYNSDLALTETDKHERITSSIINDYDFARLIIEIINLYENGKSNILQTEHYPNIKTKEQKATLHILHAGSILVSKTNKDIWIESEILLERPSNKFNYKKETFKLKELYVDQVIFTIYKILGKKFVNNEIVRLQTLGVKRLIEDINLQLCCGT